MTVVLLSIIAAFLAAAPQGGVGRVVLDPGHGGPRQKPGDDPRMGAPDPRDPARFEKDYTLMIARRVRARLLDAGVGVVHLTRDEDVALTLDERIRFANDKQAQVFVSIHLNSTEVPGPVGHETFFLSLAATDEGARRLAEHERRGDDVVDEILLDLTHNRGHQDAELLARHIQARMVKHSPFPDLGVKQEAWGVLKGAAMPAVVVEVGFINHKEEGPFITSEEGMDRLADGISEGIVDFGQVVLESGTAHETSALGRVARGIADRFLTLRRRLNVAAP